MDRMWEEECEKTLLIIRKLLTWSHPEKWKLSNQPSMLFAPKHTSLVSLNCMSSVRKWPEGQPTCGCCGRGAWDIAADEVLTELPAYLVTQWRESQVSTSVWNVRAVVGRLRKGFSELLRGQWQDKRKEGMVNSSLETEKNQEAWISSFVSPYPGST